MKRTGKAEDLSPEVLDLFKRYEATSAAGIYLLGFEGCDGRIYGFEVEVGEVVRYLKPHTSSSGERGLTFRLQRGWRDTLSAGLKPWASLYNSRPEDRITLRYVCEGEELRQYAEAHNLNLGEAFEDLACMTYGLRQNPNKTASYTEAGDAEKSDGTQVQIGYEKKSFIPRG